MSMDCFVKVGEEWINASVFSRVTEDAVYIRGVKCLNYSEREIKEIYEFVNQLLERDRKFNLERKEAAERREADRKEEAERRETYKKEDDAYRQEWRDDVKSNVETRKLMAADMIESEKFRKDWKEFAAEQREHWKRLEGLLPKIGVKDESKEALEYRKMLVNELTEAGKSRREWTDLVSEERAHRKKVEELLEKSSERVIFVKWEPMNDERSENKEKE